MPRRRVVLPALIAALLAGSTLAATTASSAELTPRSVTFRATPSSPHSGTDVTLSGTLSASPSKSKVVIQQLTSGTWKTLKERTTSSSGAYSYTFGVSTVGSRTYRAIAPATTKLAAATSPSRTITVIAKPATKFSKVTTPTVSGTLRVGSTLTATVSAWSPAPSVYTYQWRRDGATIAGATSRTYVLAPADRGSHVTVEVSALRSGARTVRESTSSTVVAAGTFTAGTPTVTGSAIVGQTLTAQPGTWTPTPAFAFQWLRAGQPISGATSAQYVPTAADRDAAVGVRVTASRDGFTSVTATSATRVVQGAAPAPTPTTPTPTPTRPTPTQPTPTPTQPTPTQPVPTTPAPTQPTPTPTQPTPTSPAPQTFGDLMRPRSTSLAAGVTVTPATSNPFSPATLIRWDRAPFTHSLRPEPFGTLTSAMNGENQRNAAIGAEYLGGASTLKNADVEFVVTGRRFAIRYLTYLGSDAMVWIDDKPVSSTSFRGTDPDRTVSNSWLTVDLGSTRTVTVRFAGPAWFSGIDHPASEPVTVTAAAQRYTIGVLSDSYYEPITIYQRGTSGSAAIALSSLTGFRVWNLAQGGTGYLNDASGPELRGDQGYPGLRMSPFDSAARIGEVRDAPISALIVNGSLNDASWTVEEHRAAVNRLLTKIAAARPGLPVVLVGIEPVSYQHYFTDTPDPKLQAFTANLREAARTHTNVVGFIDPYTENWLTGHGAENDKRGDGNQDQYIGPDGAHPNAAGQAYYQGRIVAQLRTLPLRR